MRTYTIPLCRNAAELAEPARYQLDFNLAPTFCLSPADKAYINGVLRRPLRSTLPVMVQTTLGPMTRTALDALSPSVKCDGPGMCTLCDSGGPRGVRPA